MVESVWEGFYNRFGLIVGVVLSAQVQTVVGEKLFRFKSVEKAGVV